MRVLSSLRMLLGTASAVIATGCYSPSIEDCQFSCTGNADCPDSMTCTKNICHTAGTDTATCRDSKGCPPVPGGSACGPPTLDMGMCVTLCETADTWDGAKAACSGLWAFAVLDTSNKLDALPALTSSYWVSLMRVGAVGMEWQWLPAGRTVTDSLPLFGGACGAVNVSHKLTNGPCNLSSKFICTAASMP